MRKISVLNLITFLAAFLLFQIELIISKKLLPNFGGSYLVWGSCVVFFQAVLFLGYLFAYIILKKTGIKTFKPYYLGIFLLPLLCFPGKLLPEVAAVNSNIPLVLNVFWQLIWAIGPVFFVLSTVAVILQAWLAGSDLAERNNPYALYAVSNLGSFAALISYPFLFEAFLNLSAQLLLWRVTYFLLLGLIIYAVFSIKVIQVHKLAKIWSREAIAQTDCLRWFLFSAAGVIMFLSVTNIITYEIAPIPLLWVVPLSIYLLSFVLNFKPKPWLPAWIVDKFYLTFAWSVVLFFITSMRILPFILELIIACLFLFHICMFCQHNLNKFKPVNPDNLPLFYLIIALGGFGGGVLTTWVMPLVSVSVFEYLLGLAVIAVALALGSSRERLGAVNVFFISYVCVVLMFWPVFFPYYSLFGMVIIFYTFKICYLRLIKYPRAFLTSVLAVLIITPFIDSGWSHSNYVYQHRNYYGIYKVYNDNKKYVLMNGTTIHGVQFRDKDKESQPLSYYHKLTPIGELLNQSKISFKNIGLVGLGTGSLAAYGQAGQNIDYFEIDPDAYFIAQNLFTYLKNAKGNFNYYFGDARIKIKETENKRYDILIIDAFSGDSIPVHLLTTDAIEEYGKHLKDSGIIVFHTSNRYLDFVPVLFSNANYLDAYGCFKNNKADDKAGLFASSWFTLSWDIKVFNKLVAEFKWTQYDPGLGKLNRPWTDEYSDMLSILRLEDLLRPLRNFKPFYW
ncbi:MAG: hypothetical protein AAB089_02280 [Nitrospirota bacterium]